MSGLNAIATLEQLLAHAVISSCAILAQLPES